MLCTYNDAFLHAKSIIKQNCKKIIKACNNLFQKKIINMYYKVLRITKLTVSTFKW